MIDASALVELLLQTDRGRRVERAVGERDLIAPDVVNPEVAQSLRRLERHGKLTRARASKAIARLTESDIARAPTSMLLRDVWALRHNLSAYDACYVALAHALSCPLITSDRPLTQTPNLDMTLVYV